MTMAPYTRWMARTHTERGSAGWRPALILPLAEGGVMGPLITRHDAIDHDESSVHNWRAFQLKRLGMPGPLAEIYADRIDWHQIARLVQHGCPLRLALRIVS
jgi:hypothetical protein